MKFTKIISLLLAVVMLLALCGCGQTTVEAYEEGTAPTAATLDYDAAFAMYDPETIVFTVDGDGVTWQELFYEVTYFASYLAYLEGTTITDWSAVCTLYTDEDGNYYTYGAVVLQNAVTMLFQYHALYSHLTEAGVTPGQETMDYVAEVRQEVIDDSFDGDEEAFLEYLDSMYCTEELWTWLNEVDGMYAYDGFDALYGEFGSDFSDEEVMAYAAGDEDGAWTEYVQIKQIYLYDEIEEETVDESVTVEEVTEIAEEETVNESTETENAEGSSDEAIGAGGTVTDNATEEIEGEENFEETSSDEISTAEAILAALDAAEDLDETFDALYNEYNEEPALDPFTDGWCVYEGDTWDEIYQAALDMEEYDYTQVDIDGAEVIVMKVPVDPDAGVYYDSEEDIMYTLRYYAAWQAYADLVNYDWITNAEGDWTEEFENFSLSTLFAEAALQDSVEESEQEQSTE